MYFLTQQIPEVLKRNFKFRYKNYMFNKILIAEDLDTIALSLTEFLKTVGVHEIHYTKYCDDAFLQVKKALNDKRPFELLICDLSFKPDHRENKIKSGEELIIAAKKIQKNLKTIVFSVEDKSYRIQSLYKNTGIDAYVAKGRDSIPELKRAIEQLYNNAAYTPTSFISNALQEKSIYEIEAYDIELLKALANGSTIEEIALKFKQLDLTPNGHSSIEKRINKLKLSFKANNNVQLVALGKDLGLL